MNPREQRFRAAKEAIETAYSEQRSDEQRRTAILQHFKTGARRPWARRIWKDVSDRHGGSNAELAAWLCTGAARVSDGVNHGSLSIENLVVMFAELRPRGWKPPDLPSDQELAQEGFIEAVTHLRKLASCSEEFERLSREDMSALLSLLSEKEWFTLEAQRELAAAAKDKQRLDEVEANLTTIADRISEVASRRFEAPLRYTVGQLRELQRSWADLWTECRAEVPFNWADNP